MKIPRKGMCCFQKFWKHLKPPDYFMMKYWEKIILENFSINHCGMRAGKDCWLSGTGLFHVSPAYPPQCWIHPGFTWCFCRSSLSFSYSKASQQWALGLCENWCMQKCPREYFSLHAAYHCPANAICSHTFFKWNPFILSVVSSLQGSVV